MTQTYLWATSQSTWPRGRRFPSSLSAGRREKAPAGNTIKVLYVEDVTDVREMVAFTLPLANQMFPTANWPSVEVIEAENGLVGVAKAKEHMPDVILMDLRMPKLSGTEAAIQIRGDPKTSHIPIILITAYQEERVEEAAEEVGAERAMHKPFEWDELMNAIVELASTSLR